MARVCLLLLALGAACVLVAAAPASATAPTDETTLLVSFRPGTTAGEVTEALVEAGGERDGRIAALKVQIASVPADEAGAALAELRSSADVLFAEPDGIFEIAGTLTGDPLADSKPWPFLITRLPSAWQLVTGDPGVTIAIVDTGVSPHEDLPTLLPGWDFLNGDADASDDHGHGTAVAGVLASLAGNGQGTAGVCWSCAVLPVKALGPDGYGTWSAVATGITWAADNGADVINLSLGAPGASATVKTAVEYARSRGAIVVAAAGNAGSTTPFYPADFPGVLAVAASDETDTLYSFSNRGSWVELSAPGCASTVSLGGGWSEFCGTSAAAPFVSGLLALARTLSPTATAGQLEAALLTTAHPVAGVSAGRIDARAALETLGAPQVSAPLNLAAPKIQGRLRLGRKLRADPGSWQGDGLLAFTYRWLRCSPRRCVTVGTGEAHRLRRGDRGRRLRVVVTASNGGGSVKARSLAVRVPRRFPPRIVRAN
jgi:subtilisin family serine protease